jgi:hypothetical protein
MCPGAVKVALQGMFFVGRGELPRPDLHVNRKKKKNRKEFLRSIQPAIRLMKLSKKHVTQVKSNCKVSFMVYQRLKKQSAVERFLANRAKPTPLRCEILGFRSG